MSLYSGKCDDANFSCDFQEEEGGDWIDMTEKPLGIVVVGLGIAGKVRVRDLKQKVLGDSVVLRGVISRWDWSDSVVVNLLGNTLTHAFS